MKRLVQGNEAIFFGALKAGASFFAGYPISPSSEILILAAEQADRDPGFKFIQSEDEIAVIETEERGWRTCVRPSAPPEL